MVNEGEWLYVEAVQRFITGWTINENGDVNIWNGGPFIIRLIYMSKFRHSKGVLYPILKLYVYMFMWFCFISVYNFVCFNSVSLELGFSYYFIFVHDNQLLEVVYNDLVLFVDLSRRCESWRALVINILYAYYVVF